MASFHRRRSQKSAESHDAAPGDDQLGSAVDHPHPAGAGLEVVGVDLEDDDDRVSVQGPLEPEELHLLDRRVVRDPEVEALEALGQRLRHEPAQQRGNRFVVVQSGAEHDAVAEADPDRFGRGLAVPAVPSQPLAVRGDAPFGVPAGARHDFGKGHARVPGVFEHHGFVLGEREQGRRRIRSRTHGCPILREAQPHLEDHQNQEHGDSDHP